MDVNNCKRNTERIISLWLVYTSCSRVYVVRTSGVAKKKKIPIKYLFLLILLNRHIMILES